MACAKTPDFFLCIERAHWELFQFGLETQHPFARKMPCIGLRAKSFMRLSLENRVRSWRFAVDVSGYRAFRILFLQGGGGQKSLVWNKGKGLVWQRGGNPKQSTKMRWDTAPDTAASLGGSEVREIAGKTRTGEPQGVNMAGGKANHPVGRNGRITPRVRVGELGVKKKGPVQQNEIFRTYVTEGCPPPSQE